MLRRGRFARRASHGASGDLSHTAEEREILRGLEALRDLTARDVMTPRVDVVALEAPVSEEAVTQAVRQSGHSRFPVYEDDLDHLLGILFVKDLFRLSEPATPDVIARRLRKPFLVPETRGVLDLLGQMRAGRHAFALVVDEYGGLEGVLTIKDLVSELVGDLHDEFDTVDEAAVSRVDPERWLVDGACPVGELSEQIGMDLPEGEYVTLGGFLFDRFGRIPVEGDTLEFDGYEFRVEEMERRRISKVVVRAPSGTMPSSSADREARSVGDAGK